MVDGNTIAAIARANLGKMYDSINSAGGTGYYSSTTGEPWCADFAKWAWDQAGAEVTGLTAGAISFASYGELGGTPQVGDAVVFGVTADRTYAQHVAIVVEVTGGDIYSIGGDEGSGSPVGNKVQQDGPYPWAAGPSSYMGMTISGYVQPRGLTQGSTVRSSAQVAPVVTWGGNSMHAFAAAANGSVEYAAWNGKSWNPWVNLGGAVNPAYPMPVPVAWGVNHLDVFCVGTNNHIFHQGWGGSSWNAGWDDLGNSGMAPGSVPVAVSQETDSLDVFYMGPYHNTIWRRSWRGSWGGWTDLGSIESAPGSAPAVCTWGAGRLDACVVGAGKTVMHSGWDGGAWGGGWENIGGNPAYDPALVSWGPGRLDVFITGTDGNLWHNSWNGKWLGWQDMGNAGYKFNTAPFAVCQGENLIDVFVMGPYRNTIWRRSWNGSTWSGWESLGSIASSANAKAAAASWGQGRLDVFTEVAPNGVSHSGWDGAAWSGGWQELGGDVKFF